jgi:uracil-DNA glycosylase family 4
MPDGTLSATGRALEGFVRSFGYSVDSTSSLPLVYSSDILQRYPGPSPRGGGDRRPTPAEVAHCAGWLDEELQLVKPLVVLLLGGFTARCFAEAHGVRGSMEWGQRHKVTVGTSAVVAFAVFHPAYRRRKPARVDEVYTSVAKKVRAILARSAP